MPVTSGVRWIAIGYIILALGTVLGLYQGYDAARTAKHVAVELRAEVNKRCIVSEESRAVLRREHVGKLAQAQQDLISAQKFQTGERPLPAGFTQQDVTDAIRRANQNLAIESRILAEVRPVPCDKP